MSAPFPKPPVAAPPAESADEQRFFERRRSLAPGILSRRIIRLDDIAPPAWWQHWLAGYLFTILLVIACTAIATRFQTRLEPHVFAGITMMLIVFLVAIFWGAAPAVFATVLGTLALDTYVVEPVSKQGTLRDLEALLPFIVASLIVSLLTAQRERA